MRKVGCRMRKAGCRSWKAASRKRKTVFRKWNAARRHTARGKLIPEAEKSMPGQAQLCWASEMLWAGSGEIVSGSKTLCLCVEEQSRVPSHPLIPQEELFDGVNVLSAELPEESGALRE
jgi:hypothetical protein